MPAVSAPAAPELDMATTSPVVDRPAIIAVMERLRIPRVPSLVCFRPPEQTQLASALGDAGSGNSFPPSNQLVTGPDVASLLSSGYEQLAAPRNPARGGPRTALLDGRLAAAIRRKN